MERHNTLNVSVRNRLFGHIRFHIEIPKKPETVLWVDFHQKPMINEGKFTLTL